MLFVCLADSNLKLRTALAFLEEIRKKFKEKFSNEEIMVANAYDMSAAFS